MKDLYTNLLALSDNDDTPFYHSDQVLSNNEFYRIFSYHFTDRESWLLPSALESRGIMFETTADGEFIRIASRPMHKFFNHNSRTLQGEVDFINYGTPAYVMHKADGSLISSYLNANGEILLKSKTSIGSDYAQLALKLLFADTAMYDFVKWCEADGYTVNMELVSPDPKFRIVLHYPEPRLIVLNVRQRESGGYMDPRSIPKEFFTGSADVGALLELDTVTNLEGYVVLDDKGNWWKEKADWYLERHRAKDFVNQPLAFVQLVLKDEADDIFTLLADQPEVLAEMQALQHSVITVANGYVNTVTKYWQENKDLSRKDYAIKGKENLDWMEFMLAMKYYSGTEPDWNECLLKQLKKINWDI